MTYIGIYDVGLRFGGREEGGWWYQAGSAVEIRKARTKRLRKKICKMMTAKADHMNVAEGREAMSNVNSSGEYKVCAFNEYVPGFPRRRPRYE
jgi:hypothetical protein